jgi:predicted ATPase/DNA-binding SARP family transcriptional activator
MLYLLGPSPAWRLAEVTHALPNTLPGWTIALLAIEGDWISRERLLTLLWPEAASAEAQHSLRVNLHRVRAVLTGWGLPDALEAERRRVRLSLPSDVASLRRRLAEPPREAPVFPGTLLQSMDFAGFAALREWADIERRDLAGAWRTAACAWADRSDAAPAETQAVCQQMLQADALDEQALLRLLQSLHAQARFADVDRHYSAYRERLAKEFGVEPSPALRAFAAATGTAAAPPTDGAADVQAFIGRRLELAELARRLGAGQRLITLVGPGGIGKSSLARQTLGQLAQPATWIDLQDLERIEAVAARIAQRLDIDLRDDGDAAMQIARRLGGEARVIALDNAEHLVEALAPFAQSLLDAAPTLQLLATSRQPLGVAGESLLPLEGLAVPDADSRDAEAAAAFDAVRLFELRARAARRGFELAPHIDAVVQIVDAVGGMPLAIELAASWVRLLPPAQIARDLRESIAMLERDLMQGPSAARPEHASMRFVLDRTWNLLSQRERGALDTLCVFRGSFTHTAARSVGGVAMSTLSSLQQKGLLAADVDGRFSAHPLVAAEALRRAQRDKRVLAAAIDQHAAYFAKLCASLAIDRLLTPAQFNASLQADWANAIAAWEHAIATADFDLIGRMHDCWRRYFVNTGRYAQAISHFEAARSFATAPVLDQARLLSTTAQFMIRDRRWERGLPLALKAFEIASSIVEAAGDDTAVARSAGEFDSAPAVAQDSASAIGGCNLGLGRLEAAREWAETSLGLARSQQARSTIARALVNLARVESFLGKFDAAVPRYEEAIGIQIELGNTEAAALAKYNLAFLAIARGDETAALPLARHAMRFATDRGVRSVALDAEFLVAVCLIELGDLDAAERTLSHARDGYAESGVAAPETKSNGYLAYIAGLRGAGDEAARGLSLAVRVARAKGWGSDAVYATLLVADLMRRFDSRRAAIVILGSVGQWPNTGAHGHTLVARGLRQCGATPKDALPAPSFGEVTDCIVAAADLRSMSEALLALIEQSH